jgi:hypothetical protein
MNPAKLRRSRDVSERHGSKIAKRFRIRHLAMLNMAFFVGSHGEELARQDADLIAKLLIYGRPRRTEGPHIFSGRHSTASPIRGVPTL